MALPDRQQFSNLRENFSNTVLRERLNGRQPQAAPSAQQAVPQQQAPVLPAQLQQLQAMNNSLVQRVQADPFVINIQQQIDALVKQQQQHIQTNYGEEQRRLQELQQQATPQVQQYQAQMQLFNQQQQLRESQQNQTPGMVRNDYDYLPEGLTQEEFMRQARVNMTQQYRTPEQLRQYFKPLYESYLQEKNMSSAQKQEQPREAPSVSVTPYAAQEQAFKNAQNNNNLTPEQLQKAKDKVLQESNVKDIFGVIPQSAPVQTQQVQQPTAKPVQSPTPTPGIMKQPEQRKRSAIQPSQYKGLNTNVKGLMG